MTWGILGTGAIAAHFAAAAPLAGAKVTAVASRRMETAQDFAKRFGIATPVAGLDALVALPDVDRIYIATPNEVHAAEAVAAIAAGKAVLVEKPLACSEAEARTVVDAARSHGVFCMEAMSSLTQPVWRDALAAAHAGRVGALREVHGSFASPHQRESMPRLFVEGSGGALLDRGVYLIALSLAVLGDLELEHASGTFDPETGVDVSVQMVLRSSTDARAVLSCAIDRLGGNSFDIWGSTGRIALAEPVVNPKGWRAIHADPSARFTGPAGPRGAKARLKSAIIRQPRLYGAARAFIQPGHGVQGGLEHEIAHVDACIAAGRLASDFVPLNHSLAVLRLVDTVRASIAR